MVKSQQKVRSEKLRPDQFRWNHGIWRLLGLIGVIVFGLLCLALGLAQLIVDGLWFQEVGYLSVFWTGRLMQGCLWCMALGITVSVIVANLRTARYWATDRKRTLNISPAPQSRKMADIFDAGYLELSKLLASVISLALFLVGLLTHYTQEFITFWQPDIQPQAHSLQQLSLFSLGNVVMLWQSNLLIALGVGIAAIAILAAPIFSLTIIAIFMGLGFGLVFSHQWTIILAALNTSRVGEPDPLFHVDLGFYLFQLPLLELLQFMVLGISLVCCTGVLLFYLVSGNSLPQGRLPTLTPPMQRHISFLAGIVMLSGAVSLGLNCYTLLYASDGVIFGAGYTGTHIHLPVRIALGFGAFIIAGLLLGRALLWHRRRRPLRLLRLVTGYLGFALGLGVLLPALVQSAVVLPNESIKEEPFIEYSIAATRRAFDLNTIQTEIFDPSGSLTPQILAKNDLTVRNIRLWDAQPLLKANRQLQRIRPYYEFVDADIDRYPLSPQNGTPLLDPAPRQVLISARELDFNAVPKVAQTWINKRLIYTHGYGFTVSPVNRKAPSGLPEYFVQDIPSDAPLPKPESETAAIQASIPTQNPRIYFGELTHNYVLTGTKLQELDYPSGNENAYSHYDGTGGISLDTPWRRWAFALTLRDWQMILSPNVTPQTRILYQRQIQSRVKAIAPFLRFDQDPYLVAANVKNPQSKRVENVLYWIIDAYTLSDRYPYSDPGDQPFNYIRNSIKVVVDAYSGAVDFYSVEPEEPLLKTWEKAFPRLIQPLSAMPAELRNHLRYPIDLFQAQSQALLTYHMTDPRVFYNREDQWRFPNEIYGNEQSQVQPYYLIMKLPEGETEEFVLLIPFTPVERNNLIAWMAARSDGIHYGKRLLYQFPKRKLVFGPEQIEALINQDPVISQQISLWNRQGSKILQGNLLIIPIERSLLYVEPLYLEAERTGVPTLVRVIVVYEDKIVMAPSLEAAMKEMFNAKPSNNEAIIRSIQK